MENSMEVPYKTKGKISNSTPRYIYGKYENYMHHLELHYNYVI